MIQTLTLFLLWFFVWLFLNWPVSGSDIAVAVIVSFFVTFMTVDVFKDYQNGAKGKAKINPVVRLAWFVVYVFVFVWECLKANIDVAMRVIHPDLPIRPGTIKVKTSLRSDIGLTFLANSITLTPGTTSVDIDKANGFIYIHWLYVRKGYDKTSRSLPIVGKFENILKRMFE